MNINCSTDLVNEPPRDRTTEPLSLYMATPDSLPSDVIKEIFDNFAAIEICHFQVASTSWKQFIKGDAAISKKITDSKRIAVLSILAQAKQRALADSNYNNQGLVLIEIVKMEARHDIPGAKETALAILYDDQKDLALIEIVKIEAQHDLPSAKQTALTISDPYFQGPALIEIVKIEAQHDLPGAKKTASTISHPGHQALALVEIAKNIGGMLDHVHVPAGSTSYFLEM